MNPTAFNVESTTKARAAIFTKGESPDQSPPWKSDTVSCLLTGHRREPHEGDMLVASDSRRRAIGTSFSSTNQTIGVIPRTGCQ